MSTATDAQGRLRVARAEKPKFHDDPAIDDLMAMVASLAGEVAVLRERVDTHERLAAAKDCFSPDEVDRFTPSAEAQAIRARLRAQLVESVFRPLLAPENLEDPGSHAAIVAEIERNAGGM